MADRFYARFNLSHEDFLVFKNEFDEFQNKRAKSLKKEFPKAVTALEKTRVLFIGDSISSDNLGYRISVSLAANLDAVNGSRSSATTDTLIESSLSLTEQTKPEIVSIMLGSNDSIWLKETNENMVSLEKYARNMREIIVKSKEVGAKILLFEIPLVEENLFKAYFTERGKFQTNERIRSYNRRLSEIAAEEKISLLKHEWLKGDELSPFFEPDGIHLSVDAHALFAKHWLINAIKLVKGANI